MCMGNKYLCNNQRCKESGRAVNKNISTQRHTGGKDKAVRKTAAGIMIAIIILTAAACQPTPDEPAVVYGRDLQDKIERSAASIEAYDTPGTWKETLDMKGSDAKVQIDAEIWVPDVTAFPVYKVEQMVFDETSVQPLVDYFVQGRDVLDTPELTKSDYEDMLIMARQEGDAQWAQDIEKMIEDAPVTVKQEYITDWTIEEGKSKSGYVQLDNGMRASILASEDHFVYRTGYYQTERNLIEELLWSIYYPEEGVVSNEEDVSKDGIGDVSLSEDDALEIAQGFMEENGIAHMMVQSVEKVLFYNSRVVDSYTSTPRAADNKGYLLWFCADIDGIPAKVFNGFGYGAGDDFNYVAPLYPVEIKIGIDEDGDIQMFEWCYPCLPGGIGDGKRWPAAF